MGPPRSKSPGDNSQWQEDRVAPPPNKLTEAIARLDYIRRVSKTPERAKLFRSAVPKDEWLLELSQAGVLRAPGYAETKCWMNQHAVLHCYETGAPKRKDCRQLACPFGALDRMRLIVRLRQTYARARNKIAAQLY